MQTAITILRIPADGTVEHDRRRYSVVEHTHAYTDIEVVKLAAVSLRGKRLHNLDNQPEKRYDNGTDVGVPETQG